MLRKNERGQSLVEMVLITPFLIMLLVAAIDVVGVFRSYIIMTNATREGARLGVRLYCYAGPPAVIDADFTTKVNAAVSASAADQGLTLRGKCDPPAITPDPTGVAPCGTPLIVGLTCRQQTILGSVTPAGDFTLFARTEMERFPARVP